MVGTRVALAFGLALVATGIMCAPPAMAEADASTVEAAAAKDISRGTGVREATFAVAAAGVLGACALGTAWVQAVLMAGATGVLAEKRELFTYIVILIAIPETLIILGFVMAYLILSMI